jgi:alkanesulfonate monooxygenase SsuD/methylene tetrahydromethanopterin reductase-like flavin-dependent oxidoreductase (luciferase family)
VRAASNWESVQAGIATSSIELYRGEHYSITELQGLPKPVQAGGPPIMIGGSGKQLLSLAGRDADIVNLAVQIGVAPVPDHVRAYSPSRLEEKLCWIRDAAGSRFQKLELGIGLAVCSVSKNRRAAARLAADQLRHGVGLAGRSAYVADGLSERDILESPYCVVGTVKQIAADLEERRARFGINYFSVLPQHREVFAPVIEELTGR